MAKHSKPFVAQNRCAVPVAHLVVVGLMFV